MTKILEKLFAAADNHGEDSGEPDHTVGDLQDLLRRSWEIMSVSQKLQLLRSTEVYNVVECGAQGEFEGDDLVAEITQSLAGQESEITEAGYEIKVQVEGTFFWETDDEASEDFPTREDAVADAYQHFAKQSAYGQKVAAEPDAKIKAVIDDLSLESAVDILDECFGVGCRDEQDIEDLRAEILAGYLAGKIPGAVILMDY